MIRRFSSIAIVSAIFSLCFFSVNVVGVNVIMNPDHFDIFGTKGEILTKTTTLTNFESFTVHINITTNATGLAIVPTAIVLNSASSTNVVLTYVLPVNISSGSITFAWNGSNLSVLVNYIEDTAPIGQAPVEIFPSAPISGTDIVIFFTGTNKGLKAKGFLSVNGFIYPVEIDGYAIVSLDKNAYGTAILYLFGNSIAQSDSKKVFDVQQGSGKFVSISVQKETTINSDISATVMYGPDPLGNIEVDVENPIGDEETFVTDNRGQITFMVDKIGKWKLRSTAEGQTATGSLTVNYGNLLIGLAEEEYQLGDTVTVVTEPNANIDVYVDNAYETQITASSEGLASLVLAF